MLEPFWIIWLVCGLVASFTWIFNAWYDVKYEHGVITIQHLFWGTLACWVPFINIFGAIFGVLFFCNIVKDIPVIGKK